jgi:3-dehydroquinate synthase
MTKISYKIDNLSRNIYFEKNILKSILKDIEKLNSDRKILLIFDKNVDSKFVKNIISGLKIKGSKVIVAEAEGSKIKKNERLLFKIIDILIQNKFTKKSVLICIGGGVIGDVSGLAASLYLRGILYLNIPSTMTSIIDSCLGGKTAINYKNIINSIGNYYHPNSIYISSELIKKIPRREYLAGFPEILKCALISKKNNFLKFLVKNKDKILNRDEQFIKQVCYETLKIKISFFIQDIYEHNKRLMLNFGHTFAHAIEMSTDLTKKDFYRHGEAVGLGILCELYYSNKKKNKTYKTVEIFLNQLNLPTKINSSKLNKNILHSNIYKFLYLDKKRIDQFPRYISLKSLGNPKIDNLDNDTLINETILKII